MSQGGGFSKAPKVEGEGQEGKRSPGWKPEGGKGEVVMKDFAAMPHPSAERRVFGVKGESRRSAPSSMKELGWKLGGSRGHRIAGL